MEFTKQQKEAMRRQNSEHAYAVWRIRAAARAGNRWSEYHPDNIRRRIRAEAALLREAMAN